MKNYIKILLIIFVLYSLLVNNATSQTLPLDSIKASVLFFLIEEGEMEDTITIKTMPSIISWDKKGTVIKLDSSYCKSGVYIFSSFSLNSITHMLLIDKNEFAIVNMRESFITNLDKLVFFLKKMNYSEDMYSMFISRYVSYYEQRCHLWSHYERYMPRRRVEVSTE